MKYRENERTRLDFRAKIIIMVSIMVSFLVALVPVWQKGITRQNHYELILAEEKLERIEEEEKSLIAYIAEMNGRDETDSLDLMAGI